MANLPFTFDEMASAKDNGPQTMVLVSELSSSDVWEI